MLGRRLNNFIFLPPYLIILNLFGFCENIKIIHSKNKIKDKLIIVNNFFELEKVFVMGDQKHHVNIIE